MLYSKMGGIALDKWNNVREAIPLLFEYTNERDFADEMGKVYSVAEHDEMLMVMNYRAFKLELECLVDDCDMPIWAVEYEILSGINRDEKLMFKKLLTQYTCGTHDNHYEAITILSYPLFYE